MARNQKKKFKSNSHGVVSVLQLISRETLNAITGVFSLVLAIFLVLSAFEKAGRVGSVAYEWLFYLFGIGYYLLPLVFFLLTISFIQNRKREFALPQFLGSFLLFVSALGLVNLVSSNGGLVGGFISRPLASLFDTYVSAILLLALVVISILIIFDASIKIDIISLIKRVFSREEKKVGGELVAREDAEVDKAVEKVEKIETRMNPVPRKTKNDDDGFSPMLMRKSGKAWTPPPLSLLEGDRGKPGVGDIKANANLIKRTLLNFGIVVEMDEISIGPSVTRYALKPAEGVKLSKILGLQNNLELALAAHPVRIEAPIPGKSLVGIEVPNTLKSTIGLGSLISDEEYARSTQPLFLALGRDISGRSHFANFAKMPHLLIAGATGAGKSVSIHAIINSLLFRNPPENLKFIMIDPKRVELPVYNNIPHLLTPVITDPKRAILALKWAAKEMERRYDILEKTSVRDIESYHENILVPGLKKISKKEEQELDPMPFIVIIIDELADLMQSYPRELESAVVRLAQMSRAVGIH